MQKDFNTQDPDVPDTSWLKSMGYLWSIVGRHKVRLCVVLVLGVGVALSEGLSIGLMLPFIDSLRGSGSSSLLANSPISFMTSIFEGMATDNKIRVIALALLAFQFMKAVLLYLGRRIALRLQIDMDRTLRLTIFDDILLAGLGFIHREKIANLFTILNNYTGHVGRIVLAAVAAVPLVAIVTLYMSVLFVMSWQLTVIALSMAAMTTFLMGGLTKKMSIYSKRLNQAAVQLNHIGFESLSSMRVIRLFAREDYTSTRFEDGVRDVQRHMFDMGKLRATVVPLYQISNVFVLAILLVVATFVLQKEPEFWISLLLVFMVALVRLMGPLSALNNMRVEIAGYLPAMHAIMAFSERKDKEYLHDGNTTFSHLSEVIRIEEISFRYTDEESEVLTDLSFDIPKGEVTAIVGASGSGKSTLISLLSRLYDPTRGRILVDGVDLREYQLRGWRSRIGVVSQDTFLFNETVRYNIRFGRLDATDEEVETAAQEANAHTFINAMTAGYETILGDRGVRLSGGQAQRVSIARAILANPEILILDEATSSLDTESERLVQEAIDHLSQDRTVVAVAHRLSTICNADNIVVLEDGQLVEQGTHDDLIARRGRYWHYVQLQDLGVDEIVDEVLAPSFSDRLDQSDHTESNPIADSLSPPTGRKQ